MWRCWVGVLLVAIAAGASAQVPGPPACSGTVRVEGGPDGARPLPGAKVSDGVRVVATDAAGRYRFDTPPSGHVFLVKPPGYWVSGFRDLWRDPATQGCGDFAVGDPDANLHWYGGSRVLVLADPQVKSKDDVGFFERDIVATIRDDYDQAFAIFPGRGRMIEGSPFDLGIVLGSDHVAVPLLFDLAHTSS